MNRSVVSGRRSVWHRSRGGSFKVCLLDLGRLCGSRDRKTNTSGLEEGQHRNGLALQEKGEGGEKKLNEESS
jgi:hypothetical protein